MLWRRGPPERKGGQQPKPLSRIQMAISAIHPMDRKSLGVLSRHVTISPEFHRQGSDNVYSSTRPDLAEYTRISHQTQGPSLQQPPVVCPHPLLLLSTCFHSPRHPGSSFTVHYLLTCTSVLKNLSLPPLRRTHLSTSRKRVERLCGRVHWSLDHRRHPDSASTTQGCYSVDLSWCTFLQLLFICFRRFFPVIDPILQWQDAIQDRFFCELFA